jgi:hypothetical protein
MPPAALICSASISAVFFSGSPKKRSTAGYGKNRTDLIRSIKGVCLADEQPHTEKTNCRDNENSPQCHFLLPWFLVSTLSLHKQPIR